MHPVSGWRVVPCECLLLLPLWLWKLEPAGTWWVGGLGWVETLASSVVTRATIIITIQGSADCSACPNGTTTLAEVGGGLENCTSCDPGTWSKGGTPCYDCAAGTYQPNSGASGCFACVQGKSSEPGSTNCTGCQPGTFYVGFGPCEDCPPGRYQPLEEQQQCLVCPEATYSPAGSPECLPCPAGYYCVNETGTPLDCGGPDVYVLQTNTSIAPSS